jgi:hypothetical protein
MPDDELMACCDRFQAAEASVHIATDAEADACHDAWVEALHMVEAAPAARSWPGLQARVAVAVIALLSLGSDMALEERVALGALRDLAAFDEVSRLHL